MSATNALRFDELKASGQLPSPAGVALAILRLAESETTAAQEIARVLQTDPALCGRVLKIANSASGGRARPVVSVHEAVTLLGVRTVRNVALGLSLVSQSGKGACAGFDYRRFWSRSLAMGVAAQAAARAAGRIVPGEAFTCGLLAQVGRLALASVYQGTYGAVLGQAGGDSGDLARAERAHFATDHNELTAALLLDWGLPEVCAGAARHHERPAESGLPEGERPQGLVRLVHLAARLADVCVAAEGERPALLPPLFAAGEAAGIAPEALIDLSDRVAGEWQEWGRLLQVDTLDVPSFAELAGRAAAAARPAAEDGEGAAAALTVVVVDDDPAELRLLTRHLADAGHAVHAAADGVTGLRRVLEVGPQLVITDQTMPGMDGTALVRALRETKMGRQVYVIMLTGSEAEQTQVEAFEAGADDYIVKPVRPKVLAARLRACARVVRLQDEVRRDKEELCRFMAELSVANRKLQQAALTDSLTGLYNRRYALDRLDQEWGRAGRGEQPLACLLIDVDHFKRVNDTHGHAVGDLVLKELAAVLRDSMRLSDLVCRLGGEEFVVLGPEMNEASALACAERLRANVEARALAVPGGELRMTISVGVAVFEPGMGGPAELLKAADEAVYAAKAAGRNRACLAEPAALTAPRR